MRIAWLTIYGGMVERGAEVLTREVASRLSQKHTVTVFQGGGRSSLYHSVPVPGIRQLSTDVESSLVRRIARYGYLDPYSRQVTVFARKVLPLLAQDSWDVIIPSDGGWETVLVRKFTRKMRSKCVVVGMAGVGYDDWWNLKQSPDLFISLSPQALSWAPTVNRRVPVTLIPPGVNTALFKPDGARIAIGLAGKIVLCVGALVPYKRIELAIAAVAKASDTSLLVVGSGPVEQEIIALGGRVLGDRFMLKRFTHGEMPAVYRSCDLFTLPSRSSEAFGIVYLEALASGLGIVAPDDENRRFIVGDAGVLVDVEDSGAYTEAIGKALRIDFGKKPIVQAKKFEWDKIASYYSQALTACVSA